MPMKFTAIILLVVAALSAGCETSKPDRADISQAAATSASLSRAQKSRLIASAEKARDRSFEKPPALEPVTSADKLPSSSEPSEGVQADRKLLLQQLFGASADRLELATPTAAFSDIARYDAEEHRVLYRQDYAPAKQRNAAIVAALVEGIDAAHFDALPSPSSWDGHLALQAAKNATVSFALAQYLLGKHHPGLGSDLLARRPELAAKLAVFADWLTTRRATGDLAAKLHARQEAFVLREGWGLGAALFRSSGWSGVELSRLMPPNRTSDVVRPDQWMAGEPVGRWTWPDGENASQAGLVGPAVASIWLEDVVDPRLARTIYAGYMSDAYRYFEAADDAPARFEWLSLWSSPDSARQVARAFEQRLRKRFADSENAGRHFVVFQKGLKVGVIISEADEADRRARAQHLLESHSVKLETRDGLPTSYVPTRRDELAEQMESTTLEERVWHDPATRLEIDLRPLGDDWKVQQPDRGPVRWFARHSDGSLLQLTVELADPLGPDFGSKAYRQRLVEAFKVSVRGAKLEQISPTDATPARGVLVRISGEIDKTPRTLQVWQFRRGDLVISYSLQAPPEAFDDHAELASSILDNARTLDKKEPAAKAPESGGSIEYEIEQQ